MASLIDIYKNERAFTRKDIRVGTVLKIVEHQDKTNDHKEDYYPIGTIVQIAMIKEGHCEIEDVCGTECPIFNTSFIFRLKNQNDHHMRMQAGCYYKFHVVNSK